MKNPQHKHAKTVQEALTRNTLDCQVLELPQSTRTAQDAARSIGCTIGQIIKSLVFVEVDTHTPLLILVSGLNRVSIPVIERIVGKKIVMADPGLVKKITGFPIGGIPPFGHKTPINSIFIDQDLIHQGSLWAAAGTPNAAFSIEPNDLITATQGQIINLSEIP